MWLLQDDFLPLQAVAGKSFQIQPIGELKLTNKCFPYIHVDQKWMPSWNGDLLPPQLYSVTPQDIFGDVPSFSWVYGY